MKIIPSKYKEEYDWQKWIKFRYSHGCRLSLVFLWRLAALARDFNEVMNNVYGFRLQEESQRLWDEDVKEHGKPSGRVAIPGTSWHEHHLAIDLSGAFWKSISTSYWMNKKRLEQSLNEYGLILPLNNIEAPKADAPPEWWHLQPIETAYSIPKDERINFLDADDAVWGDENMVLTQFQAAMKHIGVYNGTVDNKAGPKTKAAAEECLSVVLGILGLEDPRKIQEEFTHLKNDMRIISETSEKWKGE